MVTCDAEPLLVETADRATGPVNRFAASFVDGRNPDRAVPNSDTTDAPLRRPIKRAAEGRFLHGHYGS